MATEPVSHPEAGPPAAPSRTEQLKASPRMFDSNFMDRFTRVHWSAVPIVWLPIITVFAVLAFRDVGPAALAGWALAGYVVWTFSEYWLHRVVFHFAPRSALGRRLHWMLHGVHHDHPNDPLRLVMPPSASLPLAALFALLFQALLAPGPACALSAGFFAGYVGYDLTHYYLHHATPRSRVGRRLRELHMRHHFEDDTVGFGVSAPWWDRVFQTAPKR